MFQPRLDLLDLLGVIRSGRENLEFLADCQSLLDMPLHGRERRAEGFVPIVPRQRPVKIHRYVAFIHRFLPLGVCSPVGPLKWDWVTMGYWSAFFLLGVSTLVDSLDRIGLLVRVGPLFSSG